jgi:hypothetical protein
MSSNYDLPLSARHREELFVQLARNDNGITAQEVFEEARKRGDSVTVEAYHNLGRRLVHRGVLVADKSDRQTRYKLGENGEGQWLDEDQIAAIIDPEYPLIALTVMQESARQLNSVPEKAWVELRERLRSISARQLFTDAICGYCENLRDEFENYDVVESATPAAPELPKLRQKIENDISILKGLTKFGLGLSKEAVQLPANFDEGLRQWREAGASLKFVDRSELEFEISRRIEHGPVVRDIDANGKTTDVLVAAIDGSTRSGLLSPEAERGDFTVGSYPLVSVNTSVGQINGAVQLGKKFSPAFLRLPEKPEDMQQSDNRHTIMAKFFYPDITDGEYIHSVWNAMDVLESRAALRVMRRWYTSKTNIEVRPADVVLRDGTVVPQDRDFAHYTQQDSYGKIVRDLIEISWEVVKKCRDDDQTVAGMVKNANLRVFAPVLNWLVCHVVGSDDKTQIGSWPLQSMNLITDQIFLSRLLTAQRDKNDPWSRTCVILRPFHAVTKKFAEQYSKQADQTPTEVILNRARRKESHSPFADSQDTWLRSDKFRGENDPFVQMLNNCWYAACYIGCVPRLDLNNVLPRSEFVLPVATIESGEFPVADVQRHLDRLVAALRTVKFDVSAEHSMFQTLLKIDILPSILIRVHETVKVWAAELAARVNEYIGSYIKRHIGDRQHRGIRVRPWTAQELKHFALQLKTERDLQAGVRPATLDQVRPGTTDDTSASVTP